MSDDGNRILEQLPTENQRVKKVLECSCFPRRGNSPTGDAESIIRDKRSLLRYVIQRAEAFKATVDISALVGKRIGNGQENDVYMSKDEFSVIKLNNFGLVPEEATSLVGFIHRLITHNNLFPDDAYSVVGFCFNETNDFCIVLKQSFVKSIRYATDAEIDSFLEKAGFSVDIDDIWFNGRYEVSDVKSSNVLVDTFNNLHFVDAVVNDINFKLDRINKISIKHIGKRSN